MNENAAPGTDRFDLNAGVDPEKRAAARAWARAALAKAHKEQTPEFWARLRADIEQKVREA